MPTRPARGSDVPALAELAALTFPLATPAHVTAESEQQFIDEVLSPERFEAYLADPDRDVLVSDADGVLAGYALLVHGETTDDDVRAALTLRPTAELSKCYVHPDAHGSGTAQQLVLAAFAAAESRGAQGMWLGVNQENVRAQRFYEKSGFVRVGTKRFRVGAGLEHDFVYERPLRSGR